MFILNIIFDDIIQLLLHSKVAKAESYLIGGYHNEWLELTYYIETLHDPLKEIQWDRKNWDKLSGFIAPRTW